jgi:ketosteroid isomerase-like protein
VAREDVARLFERYRDAWFGRDLATIMAAVAPDVVLHQVTSGERVEGADALREYVARAFERWPELRFTEHRLHTGDDFAVSEWTVTATQEDGRRVEWDGVDVVSFREGLVVRDAAYSSGRAPRSV